MNKRIYKTPLDLLGVYITANLGVGEKCSLDKIQTTLTDLPLVPTLNVMAQVAYLLDKAEVREDEIVLAKQIFGPETFKKVIHLLESNSKYHIMSSHVVVSLALNALIYCRKDDEDAVIDLPVIGELLLSLGGVMEDSSKNMSLDDSLVDLVRTELWFQRNDFDRWYEMAYRIIFEVMPDLKKDSKNWIDAAELVRQATHIDLETFWAITLAAGLSVDNDRSGFWFPQYSADGFLDKNIFDLWCDFWSLGIDEARDAALKDVKNQRFRSFSTFYDSPLIRTMPKRSLAVRPWFMANKATVIGHYNLIEHILIAQNGDTLRWSRLFGEAIEELGRRLIDEHIPFLNRIDENQIRLRWGKEKGGTCDTVILGDKWLAIDFVFRRITKGTATTGNIDDLAKDLQAGISKKLLQIDATIERGIKVEGGPSGGIYSLVVIGAPYPVNAAVLNRVDRALEGRTVVIGRDKISRAPVMMTIYEFGLFLEIASWQSKHPTDIIHAWITSEMRTSSFHNWVTTYGPGMPPQTRKRRYHEHAETYLFGQEHSWKSKNNISSKA